MTAQPTRRTLTVVGRLSNGQPRSYRLAQPRSPQAAYRRLAVAILGLDVKTLALELRSAHALERAA